MLKRFITGIVSLALLVCWVSLGTLQPARALDLTGNYVNDGNAVIEVLRAYVDPETDLEPSVLDQRIAESQEAIESFYSRYRGRYAKTRSFTTFQTIFNTLASNYRGRTQPRALKPDQKTRVLTQLDQAKVALSRGL